MCIRDSSYYIERGLGMRWYAILFAAVTVLSCGLLLPGIQANSIAAAFQSSMNLSGFHQNLD